MGAHGLPPLSSPGWLIGRQVDRLAVRQVDKLVDRQEDVSKLAGWPADRGEERRWSPSAKKWRHREKHTCEAGFTNETLIQ